MRKSGMYIWHKNIGFAMLIHNFMIIVEIVFVNLFFKEENLFWLILSISLFFITAISFIYSYNWGWNAPIYLDNKEARMEIKGKTYLWKWEDVTSCKVIVKRFGWRNPLSYRIEIMTSTNTKKLVFEYSARREKFLLQLIVSENVKIIFENAFND